MKVNIIASRLHADRVLPRLAHELAKGTGWALSEAPDPKADLNYFFPYLEYPKAGWSDTPAAAWFTHRDGANPQKADLWDFVAGKVGLRTLTARPYYDRLAQFGPVAMVRPAVDGRFMPGNRRQKGRVVGLNGYSYGDDRKGEDLVARLSRSELGKTCTWLASGRNWPIPTRGYAWDEMPGFFRSLDIFMCASRVEGVPMPPLEALACGIEVIVPWGVGMLDDLPDISGIWRFKAGDYAGLERTLRAALEAPAANPAALRAAAAPYCPHNWAVDHELAIEAAFRPRRAVGDLPDWRGRAGMYCVAYGAPSRACATRLVRSWKIHMPGVPVAFAGCDPLGAGEDVFVAQPDADIGGRLAKLAVDRLAPRNWEYVLYMDADTELKEPVGFIFDLLADGWEFVICKDMAERHFLRMMDRGDNHEEVEFTIKQVGTDQVMQYNGGLFAYRRCQVTRQFFLDWNHEYQKWLGRDQAALIRAFHHNPMRVFVLMNQWNASDRYELPPGPVAVLHHNMEARRYGKSPNIKRLDSKEAWQEVRRWEMAQPKQ